MSRPRAGQHGQGIPIGEAAERLGLNVDAVRKRIRRGTLPAYKRDDRWYVVLDGVQPGVLPGVQPAPSSPAGSPVQPGDQGTPPIEAAYQVSPAVVEQAIARTGQQYTADLRAMLAELRQVYEGQVRAQAETIDALRRRAELAEERVGNELAERAALVAAKDQTIAEVQHRADLAEQEAADLRARLSTPVVAQDERNGDRGAPEASDAQSAPGEGLWARVGRWWRGES